MSDGYGADPDALADVAKGINAALSELKELGVIGDASMGRGFEDIALSGLEVGHPGLTHALDEFCGRWEWGVRALMTEGSRFASDLGLAAGAYHEAEQYGLGALKVAANAAVGNPHAGEEDVTQQSFGQIWDNGVAAKPDYSGESFRQAAENGQAGWNAALSDEEARGKN